MMGTLWLASTMNLLMMSIERYQAITKPLTYDISKVKSRLPYVLSASWVIAMVVMTSLISLTEYKEDGTCLAVTRIGRVKGGILFIIGMTSFIGPGFVLIFLFARMRRAIVIATSAITMALPGTSYGAHNSSYVRADRNITKTLIVVVFLYVVCWSIHYIVLILIILHVTESGTIISRGSLLMSVSNASVNPFVYAITYVEFQGQLKQMFCCGTPPRKLPHFTITTITASPGASISNLSTNTNAC